jgi:ankyrin repeat protein
MKSLIYLVIICGIAYFAYSKFHPGPPRTSLHQAVENGNLKLVQQHIAAKSDLNKMNLSGSTPLHLAAMKGDLAIFKALSEAGADVNRKNKDGKTPLDVAREKGQTQIVNFLQGSNERKPGRRLIDGGVGVSDALDNM